jgi:hypothetical protein
VRGGSQHAQEASTHRVLSSISFHIASSPFGKGFDCVAEDAIRNLGVADWHGREAIRNNLRQFIDKGFTALHEVVEYWDSPLLKFHGKVVMTFDDPSIQPVRPTTTHFFYMDAPVRSCRAKPIVQGATTRPAR